MALHIGPLENIINVQWPGGYWVLVTARALYVTRSPGTAHATLSIAPNGSIAGGEVLGHREFAIAGTVGPGGSFPPSTRFLGLMHFRSLPLLVTKAFVVALLGSVLVPDRDAPPVTGFCGTTTTTTTYSNYYFVPFPPPNPFGNGQMLQDVTGTTTDPTGTTHSAYTRVAAVPRFEEGHGAFTISGSADEIWYIDEFGNYVNTHRPCSELPDPGDPTVSPTKIEGFEFIQVEIFRKVPGTPVVITPDTDWTSGMTGGDIIVGAGDAIWSTRVPRPGIGMDGDGHPITQDLPDGDYDWRILRSYFSNLAAEGTNPVFSTISTYPIAPAFVTYTEIKVLTRADFVIHVTAPHTLAIAAGLTPPTDLPFEV